MESSPCVLEVVVCCCSGPGGSGSSQPLLQQAGRRLTGPLTPEDRFFREPPARRHMEIVLRPGVHCSINQANLPAPR